MRFIKRMRLITSFYGTLCWLCKLLLCIAYCKIVEQLSNIVAVMEAHVFSLHRFKEDNDDYSVIMIKAIADRLAEAFAEQLHEQVRQNIWGYAEKEKMEAADLHKIKYQVCSETKFVPSSVPYKGALNCT